MPKSIIASEVPNLQKSIHKLVDDCEIPLNKLRDYVKQHGLKLHICTHKNGSIEIDVRM